MVPGAKEVAATVVASVALGLPSFQVMASSVATSSLAIAVASITRVLAVDC